MSKPIKIDLNNPDCVIRAVTVYPRPCDCAEITRHLVAELKIGQNELEISGLLSTLSPSSIRISGMAARAVITDLDYRPTKDGKDEAIGKLKQEEFLLEEEARILKQKTQILETYGDKFNPEITSLQSLQEYLDLFGKNRRSIQIDERNIQEKLETVKQKIQEATRCTGTLTAQILAESGGTAMLALTYVVNNASWTPQYDICEYYPSLGYDDQDSRLILHYQALMSQNTGEDWTGVILKLSTASPHLDSAIPTLIPMVLPPPHIQVPVQEQVDTAPDRSRLNSRSPRIHHAPSRSRSPVLANYYPRRLSPAPVVRIGSPRSSIGVTPARTPSRPRSLSPERAIRVNSPSRTPSPARVKHTSSLRRRPRSLSSPERVVYVEHSPRSRTPSPIRDIPTRSPRRRPSSPSPERVIHVGSPSRRSRSPLVIPVVHPPSPTVHVNARSRSPSPQVIYVRNPRSRSPSRIVYVDRRRSRSMTPPRVRRSRSPYYEGQIIYTGAAQRRRSRSFSPHPRSRYSYRTPPRSSVHVPGPVQIVHPSVSPMQPQAADSKIDVLYASDSEDEAVSYPIPEATFIQPAGSTISQGLISATFTITGPVSIPSDKENTRHRTLSVGLIELVGRRQWVTTPKVSANAFLHVKAINTSPYYLLSGLANVYLNGEFVSKSAINKSVSPDEIIDLSLGLDPQVHITYHPLIKKLALKQGATTCEFSRRITIQNTRSKILRKLIVQDQIHVSNDAQVQVQIIEPDLAYGSGNTWFSGVKTNFRWANDDPFPNRRSGRLYRTRAEEKKVSNGVVEWICRLGPGAVVEIPLVWKVKTPEAVGWVNNTT